MKKLLATLSFLLAGHCMAQLQADRFSFFLPQHPGHLTLDAPHWKITQLSAKANGNEWGIRAKDEDLEFLGFLFAWPEKAPLNAETCRDEMLKAEGKDAQAAVQGRSSFQSISGTDIATALMVPSSGKFSTIRAFVASGDLCADLSVTLNKSVTSAKFPMEKVKSFLQTLQFDPSAKPTFHEAFAYATLEWDHHQLQGAASAYQAALALVGTSDDPPKWRRVTVDQLSMAQGMSGDLKASRATNEAAIANDPDYPLYYYNLACADAEAGDAAAARKHLQQAFERRTNTLAGEKFPDPAQDDSLQKLKSDASFWSYVNSLSKQLKQ